MAYVLVAIGALMAAAGLYVTGYSALYVRFEEYWVSLSAGTTLIAGGAVTAALGLALRALRDLGSALSTQSIARPAIVEAAAVQTQPSATLPALEPDLGIERPADDDFAASTSAPAPHPMRTPPFSPYEAADLSEAEPMASGVGPRDELVAGREAADEAPDSPVSVVRHAAPAAAVTSHDATTAADPLDAVIISQPPYGERGTAFSTSQEKGTSDESPRPPPMASVPPPSQDMPDDWLDRALAELDQELPIAAPPPRAAPLAASPRPQDPPVRSEAPPTQPAPEVEPAHAAATPDAMPVPVPSERDHPAPAVIGRYEADGTSYVMYSDGSIEAQSSAGVYRFSSMAELKSFIES